MKSPTERLPLILRRESFGGIVFDPASGTHIELDKEAMDLVVRLFEYGPAKIGKSERRFVLSVIRNLAYKPGRRYALYELQAGTRTYPFKLLYSPTLVDFQITNMCYMGCSHCYASSSPDGAHAELADIELALSRMKDAGVCQVALGGGEPLLHPNIGEVLDMCHEKGIVPNLSTGGMQLSRKNLAMLHKRCGAVAVSMENTGARLAVWRKTDFRNIENAISLLLSASIRTVIQVVLSPRNIEDLDLIVDFCLSRKKLYGVIFLAFKPVGRGATFGGTLATLDPTLVSSKLEAAFRKLSGRMRVGYDCCLAPAIALSEGNGGFASSDWVEGCSALRGSLGVLPNLDVVPCTFLRNRVLGNLQENTLAKIWSAEQAHDFRGSAEKRIAGNTRCGDCSAKYSCLGGCPEMELVRCGRRD